MDALRRWIRRLETERPARWDALPDFPLYMDQVLSYMDGQVPAFREEDHLTAAMVNNYTKTGIMPRAEGKKYTRAHLAYLTAVCVLKHVMPARDLDFLIREELRRGLAVEDAYDAFLASLDRALKTAAAETEKYTDPETYADAAIHFALLSYAMGLVSDRYTALLKEQVTAACDAAQDKEKKDDA